jgi:hypothetical protein
LELNEFCFEGDTLVVCSEGADDVRDIEDRPALREIQDLKVGDLVLSRSEVTGETALKRIVKIHERRALLWGIAFNEGPLARARRGGSETIRATGDHPFWVEGKGWTPVHELQPGDRLCTYEDDPTTIERTSTPEERAVFHGYSIPHAYPVYNLEVEDFNTYFVGTFAARVHNCDNLKKANPEVVLPLDVRVLDPAVASNPKAIGSPFHLSTAELEAARHGIGAALGSFVAQRRTVFSICNGGASGKRAKTHFAASPPRRLL